MRPALSRPSPALAALGAILAVSGAWWALALWPTGAEAPEWLTRTREVCFGATPDGLPDAGGWVLLIGQPLGMLALLVAVWPREVRYGLATLMSSVGGQVAAGATAAAVVVGLSGAAIRVVNAGTEPFSASSMTDLASGLTRLDDAAPAFALVDQQGRRVTLDEFRGRPVIVTFAFAHCETVCPTSVAAVLQAGAGLVERNPVVLIFTLDPWRDTPARLGSMAAAWRLSGDTHILSGQAGEVERILNAWRIPRARNERTGDISHPAVVYVLDGDGRITYAVGANAEMIAAAVRSL